MHNRNSIGTVILRKTLPTLISLAILSIIILLASIYLILKIEIESRHQKHVTDFIAGYHNVVENHVSLLSTIAEGYYIKTALLNTNEENIASLKIFLSTINYQFLEIEELIVIDREGNILASEPGRGPQTNQETNWPWLTQVMVEQTPFHSTRLEKVTFVIPIIENNQTIGALVVDYDRISTFLVFNYENSALIMTDSNQRILYTSDPAVFSPFTELDWAKYPNWHSDYQAVDGDLTFISAETQTIFYKDFGQVIPFAFLSILFILFSSFISARAAGHTASLTIENFFHSLESLNTKTEVKRKVDSKNEAHELAKLRQAFELLLEDLTQSNLSKERVSALMNSLNDLLVVFNVSGNMTLSNKAFDFFQQSTGLVKDKILSEIFSDIPLPQLLDTEHAFNPIEKSYLNLTPNAEKKYFTIRWTRYEQTDNFGNITGVTFVGMDTTMSNKLAEEIRLKDVAIDGADSGIAIIEMTDASSKIIYANKGSEKLTQLNREEIIGLSPDELAIKLTGNGFTSGFHDIAQSGESSVKVLRHKHADGTPYHLELTLSPVNIQNDIKNRYYLGILKDVTEREQTSELLLKAKHKAEESAQIKSSFLASMSHEIRTPMNGVIGMLDILSDSKLNDQQIKYLNIAQTSAESLLTIINDILDFSKVEAGKLVLEEIDFNISEMLDGFVDSMAHQALRKNLELILDTTEVDQSYVKGDPGRLRQILTNLVGNAIKFTAEGEITIRVTLRPDTASTLCLSISVIDTGIGIPEEKQALLFDPFTQVDGSNRRQKQGTGLGLAIAKQLCEAMHGSIWVNSSKDYGSTFAFRVILNKSDRTLPKLPPLDTKDKRVLVIDDNASSRTVLCKQLEKWGIKAVSCESGLAALALLEEESMHFNAAIVDMNMPVMDGALFSQEVRKLSNYKDLKLILMTSMSQRGDAKFFADLGFVGYFPKPATSSDIIDTLSLLFDEGHALAEASPLVTQHYVRSLRRDQAFTRMYRVLLVEDNAVNQVISKKYIESIGLSIQIADNGQIALDMLKEADAPFELILMDCQMPVMDGFEATRKIRMGEAGERYINTPIVAMTANAMKGDRENCLDVGMDDYISKPLRKDLLIKTLQSWLSHI